MTDLPQWAVEKADEVLDFPQGFMFASFDEVKERVAHALAEAAKPKWKPIETAPQDGTEFQAWVGHWEPRCRINPETGAFEIWGRVDYDQEGWDTYLHLTATHWMSHPTAPEVE